MNIRRNAIKKESVRERENEREDDHRWLRRVAETLESEGSRVVLIERDREERGWG